MALLASFTVTAMLLECWFEFSSLGFVLATELLFDFIKGLLLVLLVAELVDCWGKLKLVKGTVAADSE